MATEDSVRCLVVDDEPELAAIIADYLGREGYAVYRVADGRSAMDVARDWHPEVVILDLMLPGLEGVEVCRQLRTFSDAYVIMLTARTEEVDKLIGLSVGADDYVTKPFSPRELVARVKVMLRRPRISRPEHVTNPTLRVGTLTVDLDAREVTVAGRVVELTRIEFDLLRVMAAAPRTAFRRRQLIDAVWGADWFGDDHIVDVHVAQLRRKLGDDASNARFVRTVRGIGYGLGTCL